MTIESPNPFRILLATDDSEPARHAEAWVARLHRPERTVVDVLCVAGRGISPFGWIMHSDRTSARQAEDQIRRGEAAAAERTANTVGERLQRAGMIVRTWARQGDAAEEILTHVEIETPDLIVLGPKGRSGLVQLLLGSVTLQILGSAPRPVLVARRPPREEGTLPESLLILTDGSLAAEQSVSWVASSGWATGRRVTVLGLLGVPPGVEGDEPEATSAIQATIRDDATAYLDRLVEPLRGETEDLSVELESGHPLDVARNAAERLAVDVLVVARAPRRRGLNPFAAKIASEARCSVLVVPSV